MTNNQNQEEEKMEGSNVPQEKKDRFLPISIIVAAVLICGAILFSVFYHPESPAAKVAPAVAQPGTPTANVATLMTLSSRDEVLGNASAPVTVIEYADYQCPFCTRFFTQIQPAIKSQYIDTGKVKMVFRDFPFLGPESLAAANASQCAEDQGKLWAYHDALYTAKAVDESKSSSAENDGFYTRAEFLSLASKVGLNTQTFTACLDGNQHADDVSAEKAAAVAVGIQSTPTTIVNGKMITEPDGTSAGADPTAVIQAIASAVNGQ